jgi:DNA polymerase-1
MYIPDPGKMLVEFDLTGADAQCVAWEAGDEVLKEAFRQGLKIHLFNAEMMYGEPITKTDPRYRKIKIGCHATNYGGSANTLVRKTGGTLREWKCFQDKWFKLHPAIRKWHNTTLMQLGATRTITTPWGRKCKWIGRVDIQARNEALAFSPQSTVADTINRGMMQTIREYRKEGVELLLQVHDSIVYQIPTERATELIPLIHRSMEVTIPYPDPLRIPLTCKTSIVSWGHMEDWKL